jgi:hypothetical protein
MNFLRRRFSSSDLQGDLKDEEKADTGILSFTKRGPSPSAPSSPSKSTPVGLTRALFSAAAQTRTGYNKDRCKALLVIDDPHTDW